LSGFAALGISVQQKTPNPVVSTKPQYASDVDPFADVLPKATLWSKEGEDK
jgi:hypothetical protein